MFSHIPTLQYMEFNRAVSVVTQQQLPLSLYPSLKKRKTAGMQSSPD
jgi:hypothetical protein